MNCLVCEGFISECASCEKLVCGAPICRSCLRSDPTYGHGRATTVRLPALDEASFLAYS